MASTVAAGVVAVAMVDAVRNREPDEPPPATTAAELDDREALAVQAAALGVRGELPIGRQELERAARRHPTSPARAPLRVLVDGVAWLSNTRAAVLMSIRLAGRFGGMGPMAGIAFFEHGRLAATQPYFRVTGGTLGVSPHGSYVTQTPDVILRPDGSQVSLPEHLRDARDFAWSPDERFLAIDGRFAVVLVHVGSLERYDRTGGGLRTLTVPQPAIGLGWR